MVKEINEEETEKDKHVSMVIKCRGITEKESLSVCVCVRSPVLSTCTSAVHQSCPIKKQKRKQRVDQRVLKPARCVSVVRL